MLTKSIKRKNRVRFKIKKVAKDKPRLTVFRSAKNIYAQVIDDSKRVTLVSASSIEKTIDKKPKKRTIRNSWEIDCGEMFRKGLQGSLFWSGQI